MRPIRLACASHLLPILAIAGCSSTGSTPESGSSPPSGAIDASVSGLDPSARVVSLSAVDQQTLCAWIAQQWGGGYGRVLDCDGGQPSLEAPQSLQDCVATFAFAQWNSSCPLRVSDFGVCVAWEAENVCLVGADTLTMLPSQCQTLLGPQCSGLHAADAAAHDSD